MTNLLNMPLAECRADTPRMTPPAIAGFMAELPGWEIVAEGGIQRLRRTFEFRDFKAALAFTNRVGAIAEADNHHPELLTEWGKVTVAWWTYTIKGLHVNDFILAAKTDQLY
jgi:4a-hydroxytetrahydrobiopterin dehydratase